MKKKRSIDILRIGILLIIAMCAVSIAPAATAQETPFVINGYISNANGIVCDNPNVNITNMDTGDSWYAKNSSESNCYLLMLTNGTDLNAGDVLRFDVTSPNGRQAKSVEHTVTLAEVNDGGIFDFSVTLEYVNTNTWYVDDDGSEYPNPNFNTIGKAISAAYDGDTIKVYAGSYTSITVDKTLTLQGVDRPVIDAENRKSVAAVNITAPCVLLKGFKITNTGRGGYGVHVKEVNNVVIEDNIIDGCFGGVWFDYCHGGTLKENNISNCWSGSGLYYTMGDNTIYLNDFINNSDGNVFSPNGVNIWNTTEEITYSYQGSTFTGYMGNYWDDYTGEDANGDGIGDTPYDTNLMNPGANYDYYPLKTEFENYFQPTPTPTPTPQIKFDTGSGTYPSISGAHYGGIIPEQNLSVNKIYTYPCTGTGGHSKYVKIWNETTGDCAVALWDGYGDEFSNLTFNTTLTLREGIVYSYIIKTGSYPQIIHAPYTQVNGGNITCTRFEDVNGKEYNDWIPAIRLW